MPGGGTPNSPVIIRAQARQCLSTRDEAKVAAYTHAHNSLLYRWGTQTHATNMPPAATCRPASKPPFPPTEPHCLLAQPQRVTSPGVRERATDEPSSDSVAGSGTDRQIEGGKREGAGYYPKCVSGQGKSKRGDRDSVKERQTMGEIANKHFERGLF